MGAALSSIGLAAVFGNEDRVIREADDPAEPDGFSDRAFDELAGFLIDDVEDFMDGFALSVLHSPAGHGFRDRVHVNDAGIGISGDDGIADAGERGLEPHLLPAHLKFGVTAIRDVFDREKYERRRFGAIVQSTGVEEHDAPADVGKIVLDLVIVKVAVAGQQFIEQLTQRRDIPLAVAEIVDQPIERLFRRSIKCPVERWACYNDPQVRIQYQQRLAHGLYDFVTVVVGNHINKT